MVGIKAFSVICITTLLLVLGVNEIVSAFNPTPLFDNIASYTTTNPTPLFDNIASYTTTITGDNNQADIYYPNPTDLKTSNYSFPVALLLQGALVDKSYYSNYAQQVASYGFVVVVPNSRRPDPTYGDEALLPQATQIDTALPQIVVENENPNSPIVGKLDTKKVGLLGHSLGSAVAHILHLEI